MVLFRRAPCLSGSSPTALSTVKLGVQEPSKTRIAVPTNGSQLSARNAGKTSPRFGPFFSCLDIEAGAEHSLATGDPHGDEGFGQVDTTSSLANENFSMSGDEGVATISSSTQNGDAVQNVHTDNIRRLQNAPTTETRETSTSNPNTQNDDVQTVHEPQTMATSLRPRATPRENDDPVIIESHNAAPRLNQGQPNSQPGEGPSHPTNNRPRLKKNTKAHLTIGALNMRGLGSTNFNDPRNKWYHINQLMRDRKIGVLILGEAHLNRERKQQIEDLYGGKIKVLFSSIPDNPNAKGVAVALHRDITNTRTNVSCF
ncbi:hypothetical protein AAF712_016557 [Marasmius tenuissimus]|uniref:Uncharacterized protein n=1 Tax=Marasmius tenuissimus TaxID=585030 RepID=A0ABR2Z6D9_9AGAR